MNESGKPRLNLAKFYFQNGVEPGLLTDLFRYWRDLKEYGVIEKSWVDRETLSNMHSYKAVKCSKRGNDVYRWRMKKRLGWMETVPDQEFFSDSDVDQGKAFTYMLFFTLTYDSKRCSRLEAWQNIGHEYDNWRRGISQRFGKISIFRVWQVFQNGYPHIHGVLLFHERRFKVAFRTVDELGNRFYTTYRIAEKEQFEHGWHSFVDVCAVYSVKGAMKYAKRYSTRPATEEDPSQQPIDKYIHAMQYNGHVTDLDMAMMWLFSKRSYAVSGEFRSALADLICHMRNSDNFSLVQLGLDGQIIADPEVWYRWLGVFDAKTLGITHNEWVHMFEDPPGGIL